MATLLFKYRPFVQREPLPEASAARYASEPDDPDDDTKRDRWWYESSYDLRSGLEVNDDLGRTIPGDMFERLFHTKR
ncbi:MAG: hypothetical protein ABW220_17850 [Burkholderiaceae bacterium]